MLSMELDEFTKKVKQEIMKNERAFKIAHYLLILKRINFLLPSLLKDKHIYKLDLPLIEELAITLYMDDLYYLSEDEAKEWLNKYLPYIENLQKRLDNVYNELVFYLRSLHRQ
ncbi:MAG: hypothetical protein QXR84_09490 [Candidatus Bathyarchaeia archaeon]